MSLAHPRQATSPYIKLTLSKLWLLALGLTIALALLILLTAEGLWFAELNNLAIFWVRLLAQSALGLIPFLLSLWFAIVNLARADRQAWPPKAPPPDTSLSARITPAPPLASLGSRSACELIYPGRLKLGWLLITTVALSTLAAALLLYHGQVALSHWQSALSLNSGPAPIPVKFRFRALWQVWQSLQAYPWQLGLLPPLVISILIYPRWLLRVVAIAMGLIFGVVMAEHWPQVLLATSPTACGQVDPIFNRDISFYVMLLPLAELLI
ncbi:MAG: UPF0182 family protein, partial [Cyanobacteria bacterium P01_A01_bin.135]